MIRSKVRIVVIVLLYFGMAPLMAKEVKPTMLVYGSGMEAFAAALQAARSNVPTVWVIDQSTYLQELNHQNFSVQNNMGLSGGVWRDLLLETGQLKSKSDSLVLALQKDINPRLMRNAIERILIKQSNLTLINNMQVLQVVKGKKDLTVTLTDKRKYTIRAIVDATPGSDLKKFVSNSDLFAKPSRIQPLSTISADLRRTLVAIGEYNNEVFGYTWMDVVSRSNTNVFFTSSLIQVALDDNSLPLRSNVGQAVGAAAAYCSFFKVTADKIDVRKLQTELLAFESRLLPYVDVESGDPNFNAIQKVFLVSLLPLKGQDGALRFDAQDSVKIAEVKDVFNSLYSRSQLWFVDQSTDFFSVKDLLTLIKYVSFRGDEVDREVEKNWSSKLKFTGKFAPERTVNRYEFTVLVDRYAEPYAKAVNTEGKILR